MNETTPRADAAAEVRRAFDEWLARRIPGADPASFDRETPLADGGLGLDSIDQVELLTALEERFGVQVDDALLTRSPLTIGALLDDVAVRCR